MPWAPTTIPIAPPRIVFDSTFSATVAAADAGRASRRSAASVPPSKVLPRMTPARVPALAIARIPCAPPLPTLLPTTTSVAPAGLSARRSTARAENPLIATPRSSTVPPRTVASIPVGGPLSATPSMTTLARSSVSSAPVVPPAQLVGFATASRCQLCVSVPLKPPSTTAPGRASATSAPLLPVEAPLAQTSSPRLGALAWPSAALIVV